MKNFGNIVFTPSYLLNDLLEAKQARNEELVNDINNALITLRHAIIKKEISVNKNPNKILHIVEKNLEFNKQ